ncbi:ABC1-domain-containing protein [Rhizoclosmatium globosum]|uniref:ABC1-domain-containing protein n=1 Tax=Rhizoclosmatium globosum TaxID=329046 RepID=A0A1Y2C5Q7_9FUNG|nr:ABC1-domain-containing protein [Rhizoclosmatium globosum]|eukprot:ORY42369.1 ABC1-domain-containing protein [Rhizoclosmatium globosum]
MGSRLRLLAAGTALLFNRRQRRRLNRTLRLWSGMGPIITHYRLVELKHKTIPMSEDAKSADWKALDDKYADIVLQNFKDLRGFYIKVGQMMAHRSDVLSPVYIEKLRELEDKVPALMDGEQARKVVRESLGIEKVEDVFLEFSDTPIGSASIGQVHKAILKSNGKPVAVKIQSPGAEALFRNDLSTARNFCKIFAPEQCIIFDEIEKQFVNEFDYAVEAENLNIMHRNMTPKFGNRIVVPRAYPDLCARKVLTMEFLKGVKLVDGVRNVGREWCERNGTTLEKFENEMREKYAREGLPPAYDGPSEFAIDFDAIVNTPVVLYNWTLGAVIPSWRMPYRKSFIPLNSARIMATLTKVHGHQVLVDGFLNGDPHPGNFLLLEDGRLGMLDMGQIKVLTKEERVFVARIVKALCDKDKDELKRMAELGAYKSKYMDKEVIFKMCTIGFDQDGRDVTEGLNLQQFVDKCFREDPWEKTMDMLIMPCRVSLLIRGVGLMINHPVSIAKAWKPFADQVLKYEA